jgi:hypothetical protein
MTMHLRVTVATLYMRDRIVRNISVPVTKVDGVVMDRSRPGQFPKADTTHLMKTIFHHVRSHRTGVDGFVGTPLDYGLVLETKMNRSFLRKTLVREWPRLRIALTEKL